MQKVLRSTVYGLLVLAGLAACTKKETTTVSVCPTGFTGTPPNCVQNIQNAVLSVTVVPSNVSLSVGQTQGLVANVAVTGTAAQTVTWTSATPGVATVSSAGVVTAVAPGTAVITATSTVDATKQGNSTVTVGSVNVTPPTISISVIKSNKTGNAVDLSNASGQVDVALNIDPGTNAVIKTVSLIQNCSAGGTDTTKDVVVATQTLAASTAPATSKASSSLIPSQVTLSYNTAALDANGNPLFKNGPCVVKARLTTTAGATINATSNVAITLNNANTFIATISNASTNAGYPASAISTTSGLVYNQGNITASINAVNFTTGAAIAQINGTFLSRAFTATPTVAGGATFAIVFANDSTKTAAAPAVKAGAGAAAGYGTCTAACLGIWQYASPAVGEDGVVITGAVDVTGNQVSIPPAGVNAGGVAYRVDNQSPLQPTTAQVNTLANSNNFINGSYTFTGGTNAATNKYISAGDAQLGATTIQIGYAAAGSVTALKNGAGVAYAPAATNAGAVGNAYCATTGFTMIGTSVTAIPTSTTNNAYQARAFEYDGVGNVRCTDLAVSVAGAAPTSFNFGVDKSPPLAAFAASSMAANTASVTDAGQNFVFTVSDTGSGFPLDPTKTMQVRLVRNGFTSGLAADCPLAGAYDAVNKVCNYVPEPTSFSVDASTNGTGYWTVQAYAQDQAGNVSPTLTRTIAIDNDAAPVVGTITQSPSPVATLGTATFSATATDGFDLNTWTGNLFYTTPGATTTFAEAGGSFGPIYIPTTLKQSGTASITASTIFRGLQGTDVNGMIVAGGVVPNASIQAQDVVGTNSAPSNAIVAMSTTKADVVLGAATDSLLVTGVPATLSLGAATPTSATIAAEYHTANTTANPPFATLYFYTTNTTGQLVLLGSQSAAPSITDTGTRRVFKWTLATPLTPAGHAAATNFKVFIVGTTASGDAVVNNLQAPTVGVVN